MTQEVRERLGESFSCPHCAETYQHGHYAKVLLGGYFFRELLTPRPPGEYLRVVEGLPESAKFKTAAYGDEHQGTVIFYEHPSFPAVKAGMPVEEEITIIMETRVLEGG